MQVIDFLENNTDNVKNIIRTFELNIEFSSHDFIKKFTEKRKSKNIKGNLDTLEFWARIS